jgi:signal transduction histidine kinase/CheY-like chemotaxis protein
MAGIFSDIDAAGRTLFQRNRQVRAAQVRLLFANSNSAIAVTLLAAPVLALFEWNAAPHRVILAWLLYMLLASASRFLLAHLYGRSGTSHTDSRKWGTAFALGAGLAAAGWGASALLLYSASHPMNQVFLIFVLGGMMLGGASLLAPRPEAFLAFLIPTGLVPALRLVWENDSEHRAMGLLAALFTAVTIMTTWRFCCMIESSLKLRFENRHLIEDLQAAKSQTEKLNQELEQRVEERTAELNESNKRLVDEIKQRERMEEELLRTRNLESLGLLAGGIAHDFNNFLTVVGGNAELARMRLERSSPVQGILDQISNACRHAAFLSSRLLTFAKGGAPIRRMVSVAQLIADAVQLARAGDAVSFDVDVARDLWHAELDATQISQVLHNILLNAKQAMPDVRIIEVRAANLVLMGSGSFVRISIQDYGCGIPHENLSRIFDPYFTTKKSASGLGLTTAYAVVSKHGGRISVESKSGEGTLVIIDLPASQAVAAPEVPAQSLAVRNGTGRLLVMDDDDSLRTALKRILTALGYEVEGARDGAEAIALYEAAVESGRGFDAVLLDLTVSGGMGGVEAAARLREWDPAAKLIVSSGYSDAPVMSHYREHGFDGVLPKPWTLVQLGEVFRSVLVNDRDRKASSTS